VILGVEGTALDKASGEPLVGVRAVVSVRALADGSELGRQRGGVLGEGQFGVAVPIPAESLSIDQIEITITRDTCETVIVFDIDEDTPITEKPGFPRSFEFRITDPILVPACTEDGDVAP